jgi:hypoxia up-regulated 1
LHEESTDERVFISVEEITAMILKHAKILSENQGNIEIKDCVITIPSNWGLDQKRALLDSANLAGLHVLGFIQ